MINFKVENPRNLFCWDKDLEGAVVNQTFEIMSTVDSFDNLKFKLYTS